ncbi:MAG: class I SAM-dependent methyltransferase [Xanthomonadales bacterium]|nr:class I SAM-dependent methyltransferase [Xanthomonadales bacterium]
MNSDRSSLAEKQEIIAIEAARGHHGPHQPPSIPTYLQDTYWWAYLHEKSFWFFEREWVVNLILWGNMRRLTEGVLADTQLSPRSRALQVACVYGKFTGLLADRLNQSGSKLDLVDVASIQLENARRKLARHRNISFRHQDSSSLAYPDATFDQTVVFFLLHEQPENVRRQTISEALRVTRPGGKIIFVDYHKPSAWHPLRLVMKPILHWLEPFAMDLWNTPLAAYLPTDIPCKKVSLDYTFGGLYQKLVLVRQP